MKTFVGLILLYGVATVLVSGKSLRDKASPPGRMVFCRLPIYFGIPRTEIISEDAMESGAYNVLMDFLHKEGTNFRVICVTRQLVAGYIYRVQYNRTKLVVIHYKLDGSAKIMKTGCL